MMRGGKLLLAGVSLAAAGCAATQDVKVRAIADPAAKFRYGGGLLAEGRGQLALGNAGLALETFRKLQREQPESPDAFAGIAACYAAMGRFDIARQNYEFALAYAPSDARLLTALASSLDRLGEIEQAAQVRAEAARLAVAPVVQAQAQQATVTPLAVPRLSSVTVSLPAVTKAPAKAKEVTGAIGKPQLTAAAVSLPATSPAAIKKPALIAYVEMPNLPSVETAPAAPARPQEEAVAIAKPRLTAAAVNLPAAGPAVLKRPALSANEVSISTPVEAALKVPSRLQEEAVAIAKPQLIAAVVNLPAARSATLNMPALNAVEISIPALIETPPVVRATAPTSKAPVPADKPRDSVAQIADRTEIAPHMERLSTGEVALISSQRPVWVAQSAPRKSQPREPTRSDRAVAVLNLAQAQAARRTAATSALRWVPLRYASAATNVQILNAARSQGLAARTRVALLNRGWRKIGIGNARTMRQRSVVLYSARATLARRLAAHFGCKAIRVQGVQNVVVLLGRDAAWPRPTTSRA